MAIERVPEPETVMEGVQSVDAFYRAGLPGGPMFPIYQFNCLQLSRLLPHGAVVLDVACGPAHFLSQLLAGRPDLTAIGVDLSAPMLDMARRHGKGAGLEHRLTLIRADVEQTVDVVAGPVDAIVCMAALHQCGDVSALRRMLAAIRRVQQRDGCVVWLFDLERPHNEHTIEVITDAHDMFSDQTPQSEPFKRDLVNSLRAGWTHEELRRATVDAGLKLNSAHGNQAQLHFAFPKKDEKDEKAADAEGAADSEDIFFDGQQWSGPELSAWDGVRFASLTRALERAAGRRKHLRRS